MVAKLGLPLQQDSPPSESPQVGWQQVFWLQLELMPQQEPEAHWSPAVQMAPKPPVLPEELPVEELPLLELPLLELPLLELLLLELLELELELLELVLLEELAALVEVVLVPEELPVLASLLVLMLALLPVELELDEPVLWLLVAPEELEALLPPSGQG
jgi:hypothetical protein